MTRLEHTDRDRDERCKNIERLIAYNNRRCALGLRPLDIPAALIGPPVDDWKPGHRDDIKLTTR